MDSGGYSASDGYALDPYGFVADNAESQLEGRVLLRAEKRLEEVVHLPCLNAAPAYIDALAGAIVSSLEA